MLVDECQLIPYACLEMVSTVDVKMAAGVAAYFGPVTHPGGSIFHCPIGNEIVVLANLEQRRASDLVGLLDRTILVAANCDPRAGFVDVV